MLDFKESFDSNSVEIRMFKENLHVQIEFEAMRIAAEKLSEAIIEKYKGKILNGIKPRHIRNAVNTLVAKRLEREIKFNF